MDKIFKSQKRVKKYNTNRFTAWLLAVLMLFSALSTSSMTVHAEATNVAKVGDTNYATLKDAIDGAKEAVNSGTENVVIDLLANITLEKEEKIENNITLNLNSYTLDLSGYTLSVYGLLSNGGKVVDNSAGKTGLLKLGSDNCLFSTDNTQMPVYDTVKNGYVFATMTEQVKEIDTTDTDTFGLVFKPYFGTSTINELLTAENRGAKVRIGIRLEWKDENDQTQKKDLWYKDELVKEVYTANSNKAFLIKATGVTSFDNLTITPLVQSEQGAKWDPTTVQSEYDAMIAAYGEAALDENFNRYTTTDTVPTSYNGLNSNQFIWVAPNNTQGSIEFGQSVLDDTYVLIKNASGRRIELNGALFKKNNTAKKYVVVECEVGYNTSGINFHIAGRGSGGLKICRFGTISGGKFADYGKTVNVNFTAGQMYKVTYVLDVNNTKYDLYIDEVKQNAEPVAYSADFDGFANSAATIRFWAESLTTGSTDADIMLDNIKIYGSVTDPNAQ